MAKKKQQPQQPGGLALDTGHTQPLSYRKMGGSTARQVSVNARREPAAVEAQSLRERQRGDSARPDKATAKLYRQIKSHLAPSGRLRRKD